MSATGIVMIKPFSPEHRKYKQRITDREMNRMQIVQVLVEGGRVKVILPNGQKYDGTGRHRAILINRLLQDSILCVSQKADLHFRVSLRRDPESSLPYAEPFYRPFHVPVEASGGAKGVQRVHSGPARRSGTKRRSRVDRTYKFTVEVRGAKALDPHIMIFP